LFIGESYNYDNKGIVNLFFPAFVSDPNHLITGLNAGDRRLDVSDAVRLLPKRGHGKGELGLGLEQPDWVNSNRKLIICQLKKI
jgi:hypothetical protein